MIFDNQGFGSIHSLQCAHGSEGFGTEFLARNPVSGKLDGRRVTVDYAKIAEGLGARGCHVETEDELHEALADSRMPGPSAVVDIKVLPGTSTDTYDSWWRVAVSASLSAPAVQRACRQLEEQLASARWELRPEDRK
ncbi:thiamine pyrophosphate-dependent enzyme [Sulfobacillus harzensis]|uniref:Thiamine pyrophosphate enzyme TPP-binding domain-containing protein n=1 Tax=Sulfobacillus harzensis TaxID=2729629 RepID=A0A7Y0L6V0_9FIRM|nr:hypothetical protein [Sulfobacillus harzensis]